MILSVFVKDRCVFYYHKCKIKYIKIKVIEVVLIRKKKVINI